MSNYYCLVAGLPDIKWGETLKNLSLSDFLGDLDERLSEDDLALIRLYRLQFDNQNLLAYLTQKDACEWVSDAVFSLEELEELCTQVKDGDDLRYSKYPAYFVEFIAFFLERGDASEPMILKDRLNTLYYQFALSCSNVFVRDWFEFNLNLQNVLTAMNCKKYKLDVKNYLVQGNEVSSILSTSQARDFGVDGMVEGLEELLQLNDEKNYLERERKIDLLKWRYLDEQVFFHYFSVEKVFTYMIMLETLGRWSKLSETVGDEKYKEMIQELENSFEFPALFYAKSKKE